MNLKKDRVRLVVEKRLINGLVDGVEAFEAKPDVKEIEQFGPAESKSRKKKQKKKKNKEAKKKKKLQKESESSSSESDDDEEKQKANRLKKALKSEEQQQKEAERLLAMDERKRPYNSMYEVKAPTEEEMEAYYMKRKRPEDPMAAFLNT